MEVLYNKAIQHINAKYKNRLLASNKEVYYL